jgi:hypothetical protein
VEVELIFLLLQDMILLVDFRSDINVCILMTKQFCSLHGVESVPHNFNDLILNSHHQSSSIYLDFRNIGKAPSTKPKILDQTPLLILALAI